MSRSPLLEITIPDVTDDDRQKLFQFLNKTQAKMFLSMNNSQVPLSDSLHILDETGRPVQLEIILGDIRLEALLASHQPIRIRFAPETLEEDAQRKVIMRLMSTLSRRLRKAVLLTLADHDEVVLCRYSLETGWVLEEAGEKFHKTTTVLRLLIDDLKQQVTDAFK
jgi:hypothetical protein